MANYYRVSPKYWKGDRRRWDDRKKLLGLYLLTCEHRNLEGYYYLPKGYVQTDLAWPAKVVDALFIELETDGWMLYDADAEVVFVVNALAHQAPGTPMQVKGAKAALGRVPTSFLWDAFAVACASHAPKLADAMGIAFESHSNGTANTPESDADDTGDASELARRRSSSSSSSSNSKPPQPPASEGSGQPKPPGGNRRRDRVAFEEANTAWLAANAAHPDSEPAEMAAIVDGFCELQHGGARAWLEGLHVHGETGDGRIALGTAHVGWVSERCSKPLAELLGRPVLIVECTAASKAAA